MCTCAYTYVGIHTYTYRDTYVHAYTHMQTSKQAHRPTSILHAYIDAFCCALLVAGLPECF